MSDFKKWVSVRLTGVGCRPKTCTDTPQIGNGTRTIENEEKQGSDGKTGLGAQTTVVPMGNKITPGEGLFLSITLMLGWG